MAKDKKIERILDSLVNGTANNSVEWSLQKNCFSNDTTHTYESLSTDGTTKFQMEISLNDDYTLKSSTNGFFIFHKDLVDGRKYLSSNEHSSPLGNLKNLLYNKYIKPNLIIKNESNILDDILNNIGNKQTKRDKIIEDILYDTEEIPVKELIKNEEKSEEKSEEKESFFSKIKKLL